MAKVQIIRMMPANRRNAENRLGAYSEGIAIQLEWSTS
jgi:hypothetical protein